MKKALSMLLSFAMLFSMMPMTVSATETSENDVEVLSETTDSGLELKKTATLEDDGTYTIELEAYAKGEEQTTIQAMDVALIFDQSGSMLVTDNNIPFSSDTATDEVYQNAQIEGYYVNYDGNVINSWGGAKHPVTYSEGKWLWNQSKSVTSSTSNKSYMMLDGNYDQEITETFKLAKTRYGSFADAANLFVDTLTEIYPANHRMAMQDLQVIM